MSIHLVGGGWSEQLRPTVYGPFVAETLQRARERARATARVGVLQLYDRQVEDGTAKLAQFADILRGLGEVTVVPFLVAEGGRLPAGVVADLEDLDGLLVAGGPTPAYLHAVEPVAAGIRGLVLEDRAPYLGFSAGAAIASVTAVTGGWRCGDLVIARADASEGLDQLTTAAGLGLVALGVDAHAAQWGNLTRLATAVARGALDEAVAIDEDTVCIVDGDEVRTVGAGQAWWLSRSGDAITLRTTSGVERAGDRVSR